MMEHRINARLRVNLSGLEGSLQGLAKSLEGIQMDRVAKAVGRATAFYRFKIVHAEAGVRMARTIKDGRRRHGLVKHRRDRVRHFRKLEMEAGR